jgi:hypothetical protein
MRCQGSGNVAPIRRCTSQTGLVKRCGPHQRVRCSGSVQALKTSSLGVSKMRLEMAGMLISKGSASSLTEASPSARRARIARRVERRERSVEAIGGHRPNRMVK